MTTELRPILRHRQDFMVDGVVQAYETDTHIYGLFGKYRALSNFHEEQLDAMGLIFGSSEAAYMACKTNSRRERDHLTMLSPKEAKAYGQKVTLIPNWDDNRVFYMDLVLEAKFRQSKSCRDVLLSTGDKYIEETNWWNDTFWGVCGGIGSNELGKALVRIRAKLREEGYV